MKNLENYTKSVTAIIDAILRSQYRSLSTVNREQLSLYYGIGGFVSQNSRYGFWGTGAIEQISKMLQKELPGLRGFSAENIKKMRRFYEEWALVINRSPLATDLEPEAYGLQVEGNNVITIRPPVAGELQVDEKLLLSANHQPVADDLQVEGNNAITIRQPVSVK